MLSLCEAFGEIVSCGFELVAFGYVCLSFMRLRVRLLTIIHRGVTTIAEPLI